MIKVLYSRKTNLTYTVEYYKDNTTDEKNLLGTSKAVTATFGDGITLEAGTEEGQLNWKLPASGYTAGVQQGAKPHVIIDGSNVIKVLYSRKTNLTYTVEYYKDNTTDEKNLLGTSKAVTATFGDGSPLRMEPKKAS